MIDRTLVDPHIAIEKALARADDARIDVRARMHALGKVAVKVDDYFVNMAIDLASSASTASASTASPARTSERSLESDRMAALLNQASNILVDILLPAITETGIHLTTPDQLDPAQHQWLHSAYRQQIFPLLVPLAVDPGRPFPRLRNGGLNLLVVLRDKAGGPELDSPVFALIELPEAINRWLQVPSPSSIDCHQTTWFSKGTYQPGSYLWVEDTVRCAIGVLFPGLMLEKNYLFRVLYTDKTTRTSGDPSMKRVARLDVEEAMPLSIRRWLTRHLDTPMHTLVRYAPPMAMADLVKVADHLPAPKRSLFHWLGALLRELFR